MLNRHFQAILEKNWSEKKFLCIGLDSDISKLPKGTTQLSFNQAIIEATHDLVAAFKPNVAFYESQGSSGFEALKKTIEFILETAPSTLIVLDAKRADIGNTSASYAKAAFEELKADCVTLNPYLGQEAIQPFLDYKNKGSFILCRTSNPGAKEFQDLKVDGEPLYLRVAKQVATQWNTNKNCGLVVGATYPEELKTIRKAAPELPFLVPGVGSQGGDLKQVLEFGRNSAGNGLLINLSRSILFASSGPDFAESARKEILKTTQLI
ncbi:MAG: orotidine 5'-phosphate decarboxylase [Deltaproteobacteria bacterium RIFCSPLOWO2_12_FULL_44_12]|nr:MAG: orotidine 5'-phosphate decarboxylase [Deltaproteobacteria bacterium RIFCSPHIGHO2_01_FULL_43_49]OGQ16687.1 MAG: orotidine 5'-phosphate decarboxylase [Deltaproteobacteria bacterium RIFCSPHIGHO2_02_FULL_44_53]OGQ29825.1 MAG: orotidine 5'-phosphate decarboxylase [Deltaproteobacteria bacterium RIFCSPHIGHO2_12_FULL_44_21]OGQ33115.1 MAG: orotidine 5'-phosphate decarboxylase [Deltaproteobacteria bacterium RIFCSPLOWO2_01_FULL_45_74]OGQ42210.1 MAG: orotidine 5'-phosphate decarboxylase [Deltaprote